MKEFYVIQYHPYSDAAHVSGEGYSNLEEAKKFLKTRCNADTISADGWAGEGADGKGKFTIQVVGVRPDEQKQI